MLTTGAYTDFMPREIEKRTKVTVFLLKKGREKPENFLIEPILNGVDLANIGTVFTSQIPSGSPTWAKAFFPGISAVNELYKSGAGAILQVAVKVGEDTHSFLVSFGYGYHKINTGACVEQFGLKVALNAGNLTKIRSLDKRNLSSTPKLSREQLALQESIQSFEVDYDQDMMQGLTLSSSDEDLGKTITGGLGISFTTPRTVNTIHEILPKIYGHYVSKRYITEKYDWIDNIKLITAPSVTADLNVELLKLINKHKDGDTTLVLSVPEIQDWDDVRGFAPNSNDDSHISEEIILSNYLRTDGGGNVIEIEDIQTVKRTLVHMWSSSSDRASKHWTLYRCITTEIEINETCYVLSDGKWYEINKAYANAVDKWYSELDIDDLGLPVYKKSTKVNGDGVTVSVHNENGYNATLSSHGYTIYDGDLINIGQHKDIEACDLFKDNNFVHVKIFTGQSSPISHLLAQATVASELFFGEREFREAFNEKLTTKLADDQIERPSNANYTVTLAVITDKSDLKLPFFSRVNLRSTMRRLELMGVNTKLAKIEGDFS